jgi:aldehyde dehydrogenase (NAD+)
MNSCLDEGRCRLMGQSAHASRARCIAQLSGGVPAGAETGYFVEATVIADVHPEATILKEDVFGPVLAVTPHTIDVNRGTWFARDSPFGGVKQGGLGRKRGRAGPEEYLETRVIGYPLSS